MDGVQSRGRCRSQRRGLRRSGEMEAEEGGGFTEAGDP